MMTPIEGDAVIKLTINFQGVARYGHTTTVKSVYKNGNVILAHVDGQHNVTPTTDGAYQLTACGISPVRATHSFVKLTSEVELDVKHSKRMHELMDLLYDLSHTKQRAKKFNAQTGEALESHIAALKTILKSLSE